MADNLTGSLGISRELINTNVGGYVASTDEVRDPRDGKTSLRATLDSLKEEPDLFNTVVLSSGGDDSNTGLNFENAVANLGPAMTIARGMTSTDHKTILAFEARNFGNLINNDTVGDVPNLIVDARSGIFEDVDLTQHSTGLDCRRIIGNVTMGNQSSINAYSISYSQPKTISFSTDEVHQTTRLIAKLVVSNHTISFAGVLSNSHIHVGIDRYEGDLDAVLATIPTGVTITGFIGGHLFGKGIGLIHDFDNIPPADQYQEGDVILVGGDYYRNSLTPSQAPNLFSGHVDEHLLFDELDSVGVSANDAYPEFQASGGFLANPNSALSFIKVKGGNHFEVGMKKSTYETRKGSAVADGDQLSVTVTYTTDDATESEDLTYSHTYTATTSANSTEYVVFEATKTTGNYIMWTRPPREILSMAIYEHGTTTPFLSHEADLLHWVEFTSEADRELLSRVSELDAIPRLEQRVAQLESHQSFTVVDENILEVEELPDPNNALPAQAVLQLLPGSDRTKLVFVSKANGSSQNGVVFRAEHDATANPVSASVATVGDVTTITIGFGAHTNSIRSLADQIEALPQFPTADWHVDPFFFAGHSVAITSGMASVEDTSAGGKDAASVNYVRVPEKYTTPFDSGAGGVTRLPGLYQLVDNITPGRFRVKFADNGKGYNGFWSGGTYPANGGPGANFGKEVFIPNAGSVIGIYRNHSDGFHDYRLVIHEGMYYAAMVDRVRYIWSTVSDPRQRGDENSGGVTPLVANPHEFNPAVVIHDNLIVSFYPSDDLGNAAHTNVPFNVTGQKITVGGVTYRVFESLRGDDILAPLIDKDFVEIDMRLDVDHDIRVCRNWAYPYAQDNWSNVQNLHQDTQAKTWKAVDVFHPTVSEINNELNDLARRVRALENP